MSRQHPLAVKRQGYVRSGRVDSSLRAFVARLAGDACTLLGQPTTFVPASILVEDYFTAPGYGVLTDVERRAIDAFARQEGILLDPVYPGRAAGGLLGIGPSRPVRQGRARAVLAHLRDACAVRVR